MKQALTVATPLLLSLLAAGAHAQEVGEVGSSSFQSSADAGVAATPSPDAADAAPPAADAAAAPETLAEIPLPAEEQPVPESEDRGHSRLMGEVIVTAQKREENLQNVPISIQAFTGENLDARGVTDATALQRITPGLTITQSVGFTLIYLRGIGSDAFLLGDPSVAYYIDNIYFPFSQGLAQEFGAVDRVEVLKGPQGTLFGRNAVGGAVNVITKAPSFGERYTTIESEIGNYSTFKNRLHTNIPLGDSLALSVSALYNTQEFYQGGTIDRTPLAPDHPGSDTDPIVTRAARVKLRWAPFDNVDATFAGLRYLSQGAGTLFQLNAYPSPLGKLLGIEAQKGYNGTLSEPVYATIDNKVWYGDIKWNLPWFDVRMLGSDQMIESGDDYDYDGSPQPLVGFDGHKLFADVQSAELQFLSNDFGPKDLKWIVGAYFFQSKSGYDDGLRQKVGAVNTITSALLNFLNIDDLPQFLQNPVPTGNVIVYGKLGTRSMAYFAQASYDFTKWMGLTLGGRYQDERRYIIEAYDALETAGSTIPIYPLNPDSNLKSTTTDSFSPKVSLDFHPGDNTLVYLSFQQATKSGTFNPLKLLQPVDYVKPEKTSAYELGAKTSLFGGLMQASGAVFYYDINNLQVQYVSLLNGGVVTFESAKGAEVRGFDFDVSTYLVPNLVDNLALTFSGAYLDAKFTDFKNGSGFSETTGIFTVNNDFTGNRISRAPRFSGTVTLSKTWDVPGGPLEAAADYYYNSGFFYTAQNSPVAEQKAYDLVGVRLSYKYEPWQMRATLYGNNIFDKYYSIGILQADFGTNVSLGAPATYGVRLSWEF